MSKKIGSAEIAGRLSELLRDSEFRGIVSVYLFGSVAEKRNHRESDVDLAVLFNAYEGDSGSRFNNALLLSSRLQSALRTASVDLVVLNDAPPQLGRLIVTRGRRIFCRDPHSDHNFVRDVQLRAADLEPFLRRTRRLKLEAIGRS